MDGPLEAARRFSHEQAYPGRVFPVVENGAHCLLCQQDLDHAAGHRLSQFEAFVASTTERELRHVRETFARLRKNFADFRTTTEATEETLKEIRIEHEAVGDAITAALTTNENRRKAVVLALTEDKDLAADCRISCPLPTRPMRSGSRTRHGSIRCAVAQPTRSGSA